MYKYKKFLIFYCAIAILLLWIYFPISFDNNDDQAMFVISSGFLSGVSSPNIILSNILIGKLLTFLFSIADEINWYTLYLQIILFACTITISWLLIKNKNISKAISSLLILFLFLGVISVYVITLQFTMVAFMCVFTALFLLQSDLTNRKKIIGSLIFLSLAILVRKEALVVYFVFSLPIIFTKFKQDSYIRMYSSVLILTLIIFGVFTFINLNNATYKQQKTYQTIKAIDILAAKPIRIDTQLLHQNNFSKSDILLIQNWFPADNNYLTGNKIMQLAEQLKSHRNGAAIFYEFKKFILDERYAIVLFLVSFAFAFATTKNMRIVLCLNLFLFILLISYLILVARLPHRVSFPILTYLVLCNLFYLISTVNSEKSKIIFLSILLLFSAYKFYCTLGLYKLQKQYHAVFEKSRATINAHPDIVFIGLDGFPIQYMNAWQKPSDGFPAHNVIMSGWYAASADYQQMLNFYHLKNLTLDLVNRKNILFLTNSTSLQDAYLKMMQQRYSIRCHFETVAGFETLQPKKLVLDNSAI